MVKCSKRPFLPNRHIESPAERETIDCPSVPLGGRRVPNVDSIAPPGPDELLPAGSGKAAICAASASLRSRCGSNNLGPCDLFSGYFVVDLPRNVKGLGPEPSGLFRTSFWGESWNVSVSHLRFILVASMVPKCTCSNYNDVDDDQTDPTSHTRRTRTCLGPLA